MDGDRRSRILSSATPRPGPGRGVAIAVASTIVFFGLLAFLITRAPNWDRFRAYFFDGEIYRESLPEVADAFVINVRIAIVAEVFIVVTALGLALLRSLPGPVFFPVRALAIVYSDFFRGVPTILVILMLGVGMPSLGIEGIPNSEIFWATLSLVLVYTAYVSEVYRAGIESVHPSQDAAARSLGLTRFQSLRSVVVPQAVRRVIPPLLNDFIGLQKDTALVSVLGVVEALNQAQINEAAEFNGAPFLAAATLFVLITIPQARFTDWLIARDRKRRQAAGAAFL